MQDVTPSPAGEPKQENTFRGLFSRMAMGQCVHAALCVAVGAAIGLSTGRTSTALGIVLGVLVCAGVIVFAVFEIPVVRDARTDTDAHPGTIIVLGAGVNGSTPSLSMCNRLDAALAYLDANPDALAVVSGGQGEGEDITEAKAMADYLTAHGIDSARIVQEDRSRTTRENLENSFAILRARGYDPANGVGIVTSEYHLYRAKRMARSLGADPAGIAAETTLPSMRINYFIREAFAAAYMQLAGTLY